MTRTAVGRDRGVAATLAARVAPAAGVAAGRMLPVTGPVAVRISDPQLTTEV